MTGAAAAASPAPSPSSADLVFSTARDTPAAVRQRILRSENFLTQVNAR